MPGIADRCRKAVFVPENGTPPAEARTGSRIAEKAAGFSLLEVLVAMALTLGLIVATAEMIAFALWAKHKGDTASAVASVIAARIETLKGLPFEAAELAPGDHAGVATDGPSRRSFSVDWTVEEAGAGGALKRVQVTAAPVDRPAARARITVFISRDLGFAP